MSLRLPTVALLLLRALLGLVTVVIASRFEGGTQT